MSDAAAQDLFQNALQTFVLQAAAIATTITARIDDATNAEIPPLANTFDRVTQGARRAILLIDARARAGVAAAHTRVAARKRIYRDVTNAIAAERLAPERAEALRVELVERLESFDLGPDLDIEIAQRRVEDIVYDLKRDMGLADLPGQPKWPRRTPDDVADILTLAYRPAPHPPPHHP